MQTLWSEAKARVSHRLAMHLRVAPTRLRNDAPMVSFTFDDIPKSAATLGAELLERHGARGTFYVAGGLLGTPSPDWVSADREDISGLHARGHEIACHTYSHVVVSELDDAGMLAEFERNARCLRDIDGAIKIENFAYPYGLGAIQRKPLLRAAFHSCRGIGPGVNSGEVDLQLLRATPLIGCRLSEAGIDETLDEARKVNGWLIFYTHDVAAKPSPFGCSPQLLEHALTGARQRGITIHTMTEALRCSRI